MLLKCTQTTGLAQVLTQGQKLASNQAPLKASGTFFSARRVWKRRPLEQEPLH